jgi:hypothetical protein
MQDEFQVLIPVKYLVGAGFKPEDIAIHLYNLTHSRIEDAQKLKQYQDVKAELTLWNKTLRAILYNGLISDVVKVEQMRNFLQERNTP